MSTIGTDYSSIVFITPVAFQNISWRTWIILAATNFTILPLVYFFYPETAYRSLEEVDVIFQLADDEPGSPWYNVVHISKSEPLWFGKRGEKREEFNYANSSWHKRLLHSSSNSSGNGSGSNNEKRSYGTTAGSTANTNHPSTDSDPDTCVAPLDQEPPIDPMLAAALPSSPFTSVTTTIHSENQPSKPRKKSGNDVGHATSRSKSSSTDCRSLSYGAPALHHQRARRDSEDSIHSVRPEWWTERLAPAPLSIQSRTSSLSRHSSPRVLNGHNGSLFSNDEPRVHQPSSRHDAEVWMVQDPYPQVYEPAHGRDSNSYHAHSVDHRDDSASTTSYPGILGDGMRRTSSQRTTYLPDGIYEVTDGRVRSLSTSRDGERRRSARSSGRGY